MTIERDPSKVDFTKDGKFKLYPDDPTSEESMRTLRTKDASQYFDPCAEAAKMSMNCLDRNNYDKKKCKQYFEAYRDCTRAWKQKR